MKKPAARCLGGTHSERVSHISRGDGHAVSPLRPWMHPEYDRQPVVSDRNAIGKVAIETTKLVTIASIDHVTGLL